MIKKNVVIVSGLILTIFINSIALASDNLNEDVGNGAKRAERQEFRQAFESGAMILGGAMIVGGGILEELHTARARQSKKEIQAIRGFLSYSGAFSREGYREEATSKLKVVMGEELWAGYRNKSGGLLPSMNEHVSPQLNQLMEQHKGGFESEFAKMQKRLGGNTVVPPLQLGYTLNINSTGRFLSPHHVSSQAVIDYLVKNQGIGNALSSISIQEPKEVIKKRKKILKAHEVTMDYRKKFIRNVSFLQLIGAVLAIGSTTISSLSADNLSPNIIDKAVAAKEASRAMTGIFDEAKKDPGTQLFFSGR